MAVTFGLSDGRTVAFEADWDESKHPRDDKGRFGESGGGTGESGPVVDGIAPLSDAWQLTPDEFNQPAADGSQWVFHATSYKDDAQTLTTDGVLMDNVPQNLARQRYEKGEEAMYAPGAGVGQGLYVLNGGQDITGYGRYIVGIRVKPEDLAVPPESTVPSGTVAAALNDHNGAIIARDVPADQVHYFGHSSGYSNWTPHEILVYNAALNGETIPAKVRDAYLADDRSTTRTLRDVLTNPPAHTASATFEWDEEKHPRDEKGRFGPGSGGEKAKESRPVRMDVPGIDPAIGARVEAQLSALQATYPDGPDGVTWLPEGVNSLAVSGRNTINLSQEYFSDPVKMAQYEKEWDGLHVNSVEGVIAHEYGHALKNALLNDHTDVYRSELQPIIDVHAEGYMTPYGADNDSENAAELFAVHVLGMDDPAVASLAGIAQGYPDMIESLTTRAAAVGEILGRYYKR